MSITAPRGSNVYCTQCHKHYEIEPDRCECGCTGFSYSDVAEEPPPPVSDGWEWAVVEIFGHRSHAGRCREEERFGAKMLRIDIPIDGDPAKGWKTHFYGGSSVFSYTLTDEASVMKANKPYESPYRARLTHVEDDADLF